jgi:hypothetical protein
MRPPQDPWPDLLGGAMQLGQACRRLHVGVGRARRCQRREIARMVSGRTWPVSRRALHPAGRAWPWV